ncbi:uncharacterized protein LOC110988816 [Acanthaster planci]|uniref:Uncharacterized protein LOC110988816 n=1 Tax=Acanthaster planci TaxID=133434 RepID=A0A8B7ZUA4_ACAPL|nr:uncharacterized protein LOC110988816 [Acanthaster planci]
MADSSSSRSSCSWQIKSKCAMLGCSHNRKTCPSGTFFRFPMKSSKRLQLWTTLSGRLGHHRRDGSLWKPGNSSRMCACHFEDGKKCNDPTLNTGADYTKEVTEYKTQVSAHTPVVSADHCYVSGSLILKKKTRKKRVHRQIQVDFPEQDTCSCPGAHARNVVRTVFCSMTGTEAGTQTSFHKEPCSRHTETRDRRVGPDAMGESLRCTRGFHGFDGSRAGQEKIHDLTGMQPSVFFLLLSLLPAKSKGMSLENCLLLFLMKLRYGLPFTCLGVIFSVFRTTASRAFNFVLENLSRATHDWIIWPSAQTVRSMVPSCFSEYPNVRCIIDCLEFKTERPPSGEGQALMYSHNKGTYTCKVLVGISPHGLISFLSEAFPGGTTDSQVATESGVLDLLEPDDVIIASQAFPEIGAEVPGGEAIVVLPPFTVPQQQFAGEGVQSTGTYKVSPMRVHVERIVHRIRFCNILNAAFPRELLPCVNDIVRICAVLANLQSPQIQK